MSINEQLKNIWVEYLDFKNNLPKYLYEGRQGQKTQLSSYTLQ